MAKKSGKSEEYSLSEAQLNQLWKQSTELIDKVIMVLCAYCGLRIGEAIHLNLDWIRDQDIHIPSQMPCDCHDCALTKHPGTWKPKTPSGSRVIPIPAPFQSVLHEFLKFQPDGLKMGRIAAFQRVKRLARNAKISTTVFPHSLRASYVTLLASKGMEAPAIAYLIGHKRIDVLQSYMNLRRAKDVASQGIHNIFG